jgi:hypothetical protein
MTRESDCTSSGVSHDQGLAANQTEHPVTQVEDEPHVVLDDHHGQPGVPDLEDQVAGLTRLQRVHACRRLIQQDELGVCGQRPGDLQTTLVAIGQVARQVLGGVPEADESNSSWARARVCASSRLNLGPCRIEVTAPALVRQ